MRTVPPNLAQGRAGEYQVASQLSLRGYNPHFPSVDIGYDLLLGDSGLRIQVKSAKIRKNTKVYPDGAYWFKLMRTTNVKNRQLILTDRVFSEECDVVVFWGIDENRFWIIPSATLDRHQCVVLGPKLSYCELDVEELKRLHEAGLTQQEIAERLGVSSTTVSRRLRGLFTEPSESRSLSATIRKLEDRWDLIDQLVKNRKRDYDTQILIKETL